MKRRIFVLLLAVLLLGNLALSAAADAYIPPDEGEYFDMCSAYMVNGTCKALNTFLSNFVEMGLAEYSSETTDEELIPAVLKHMELNARYYPKYVKKVTKDGAPYMQITGSHFEERAEHLFGRTISATECPGYDNGKITVSADHYDGPIQVFASVYDCLSLGDELYRVSFDVLRIDKDFSGWYTTAYPNLPWDKLTTLGSGTALVVYGGGKDNDTISTSDFTLVGFEMDAKGIPCMGENLPLGYTEPTEAPTVPEEDILDGGFDIAVEAETEDTPEEGILDGGFDIAVEAETEDAPETPTFRNEKEFEEEEDEEKEPVSDPINITTVLIIILVAAVVLLALLLIVILLVKKKRS